MRVHLPLRLDFIARALQLLKRLDSALLAGDPGNNLFYQEQRSKLKYTLAAIDATDRFNIEVASNPSFNFSTDYVTPSWPEPEARTNFIHPPPPYPLKPIIQRSA